MPLPTVESQPGALRSPRRPECFKRKTPENKKNQRHNHHHRCGIGYGIETYALPEQPATRYSLTSDSMPRDILLASITVQPPPSSVAPAAGDEDDYLSAAFVTEQPKACGVPGVDKKTKPGKRFGEPEGRKGSLSFLVFCTSSTFFSVVCDTFLCFRCFVGVDPAEGAQFRDRGRRRSFSAK